MLPSDALAAKDAGADFVGLMFAPESRRRLSVEEGRAIVASLTGRTPEPPLLSLGANGDTASWFRQGAHALDRLLTRRSPLTVGVFEDQTLAEVNTIAAAVGLDLIQLSGDETWAECLLANRQVVKAVDVPDGANAGDVLASIDGGTAIACLLDVSRGKGVPINPTIAAGVAQNLPVWIAGGLSPENVSEIVAQARPWAVDVSSGVETDGAKDAEKIRAFVQAAKGAPVS
jgi:anthranilate synthase/indole-3-glycerol phosphate synthase/phosphoribosylanthranilate isomerase